MTYAKAVGMPPAISRPETRAATRNGVLARWTLLLFGAICLPLTILLIDVGDRVESATLATTIGVARNFAAAGMTVGLIFGTTLFWINRRRRRALTRYPWIVWPINYVTAGRYEWVELLDRDGRPVSTLILSTWSKDIGKLVDHDTSEVWFAGDPTKYGVISRPGGGDLRYAYFSKSRQPPRLMFRKDVATDDVHRRESSPAGVRWELSREDGVVTMQPVGGPPVAPVRHGAKGDDRYPTPRTLRRVLAFVLDWTLHFGIALGATLLVSPDFSAEAIARSDWKHIGLNPAVALGFWLAASALDRVVIQAIFHTTVGKALFGLRVIRPDDGTHPTLGKLLAVWLVDLYMLVAVPISFAGNADAPGPDKVEDYFLPAVRRRDLKPRDPT
ncbi:RDD family protein [Nocardia bovistercoris]|uniref:RDD family protein n=1 Tax=Nocardia bovistercoris TaxID=2785916 RepID=A0A931N4U9_9NOCA|nr:RDD family protein [Nocardia bovistercoris]MBH0778656.1 RDD family protein [Nocardia bovistercoris]